MPPLPVTKTSPGRDHRTANNYNRGHSFKFGMTLHATKDDDLALFNDMQIKERESFLLHTSDDFGDSLNIKLGITIPDKGRDDLLDADGEKNDYDWLLTPPDTPLFPSLDDEETQRNKQPIRGRPRSQPISISRSLPMNDISQKNTRINASPRRLSPSPRSNNNNSFAKSTSRPSSAIRSSPPPVSRSATPSRRPSTPNRPSTPRSLTPTPKVHGTSPMRSSRGNSASPKIHAWQTNLLGFSSDVPPNLRTSLSDRPSPPMRGLSPTPSSGRGRHSMSPTCSRRSVSSSNSNGRDFFSSCSKSSFVSSCDDDVDSLQSVAVTKNSTTIINGMVGNSKAMRLSKKSTRSLASNSVPKRSFEPDIRQSDQHKAPQKMFRPLLSSVPPTTFYVGKASNTNRIMFSRNSSLTTNTSASSDQGTSAVGEWEKMNDSATQDEVFVFDKGDDITDYADEMPARNPIIDCGIFNQSMSVKVDVPDFDGEVVECCETITTCTKCGKCFSRLRLDENIDICEECTKIDGLFAVTELLLPSNDSKSVYGPKGLSMDASSEFKKLCSKCGKGFLLLELEGNLIDCEECIKINELYNAAKPLLHPAANSNETNQADLAINIDTSISEDKLNIDPPDKPCSSDGAESLPNHNECTTEQDVGLTELNSGNNVGNTKFATHTSLKIENPEGKGISVLLPRHESNSRSPIIQSTAFTAASILCADPSYIRDNASALRRSIEKDVTSTSSSIDMGSYKRTDSQIHRHLSESKYEISSVRCDTDAKSQHSGSCSEFTANTYPSFTPPKTDDGDLSVIFTKNLEKGPFLKAVLVNGELDESLDLNNLISTNIDGSDRSNDEQSALKIKQSGTYDSCDNPKDQTYSACRNINEELRKENDATEGISVYDNSEQNVLNAGPSCQNDSFDTITNSSPLAILESQIELSSSEPDISSEPAHFPSTLEVLHEHSITAVLEDVADSTVESCIDHNHEESTVIVEGRQGQASRSLTLAEATDTILFCSSIIHDIAYKAASIAIEKESAAHLEASRPTVTIIEKSVTSHRGSMKANNRISTKPAKFGRKKTESQTKTPLKESETNVNVEESTPLVNKENVPTKVPDSVKPPKLESKCNCTVM